ncbi:MAG: hypothetical protein AAB477_02935 [Patescibacteria group bacterium]
MKNKIITFGVVSGLLPLTVFAKLEDTVDSCKDIGAPFKDIGQLFNWAGCTIIKSVVPLLFSLAVAGFIWGIIQYYLNPDNEEKRKKGKTYIIWGLVALFVMISMWGLVGVLTNTFGIKTLIPQLSQ